MADLCCPYTFGGITINSTTPGTDRLILGENGVVGLDGAPIRAEIDDQGQSDGGIVHPKLYAARIITFTGFCHIQSAPKSTDSTSSYVAALNALEAAVISALEAKLNTADTLSWTPYGQSARSLSCTYGTQGGEIKFGGVMLEKTFEFTLVAEDPTIT